MITDRINRRQFLRLGATIAGGVLIACRQDQNSSMPIMEPSVLPEATTERQLFSKSDIFFAGQKEQGENHRIFRYNPDNQELEDLLETSKNYNNVDADFNNPVISPNGRLLACYADVSGLNQIHMLDLGTREWRQVTREPFHCYDASFPLDGQTLIVKIDKKTLNGEGDLYQIDLQGNILKNITPNTPNTQEWGIAQYSPDRESIYYVKRSEDGGDNSDEVYQQNIKTGEIKQLTKNNIPDWYPAAHPTQNILVEVSKDEIDPDGPNKLYSISFEESGKIVRTKFPGQPEHGDNADPSWNYDGTKLAFLNNEFGIWKLHTINADGSNVTQYDINGINGEILGPVFYKNPALYQ
jgi:Tol biopolymer transport system component